MMGFENLIVSGRPASLHHHVLLHRVRHRRRDRPPQQQLLAPLHARRLQQRLVRVDRALLILLRELHDRGPRRLRLLRRVRQHESVLAPVLREPERLPPRPRLGVQRLQVLLHPRVRRFVRLDVRLLAHRVKSREREQPRLRHRPREQQRPLKRLPLRRAARDGSQVQRHVWHLRDVGPSVVRARPELLQHLDLAPGREHELLVVHPVRGLARGALRGAARRHRARRRGALRRSPPRGGSRSREGRRRDAATERDR